MNNRIIVFASTVVLSLIVVVGVLVPLITERPNSTTPFQLQEANALTAGNYRASVVIFHLLQCTPVAQSNGAEVLDGTVKLIITGTLVDALDRENEMDARIVYTGHFLNGTHMGNRVLDLAIDMPVESNAKFTLYADLPSHENTDHFDIVTLQFFPTSISGTDETQTIAFPRITLQSCR